MAKGFKNKGHLVIQMNIQEATKCNFGFEIPGLNNLVVCGTCNNECKPANIYYIAALNEVMCEDCMNDYCNNMNHHNDKDSLKYEIAHFNDIGGKLNIEHYADIINNALVLYTDKEMKEYIADNEANDYLSSMEAHETYDLNV